MKFGLDQLKAETPIICKRVGNILLAVSTFVAGYSFYNSLPYIGIFGLVCGILGKTLTEMFGPK